MAIRWAHLDRHRAEARGPEIALSGGMVLAGGVTLLAAWKIAPVLILPVASLVLLAAGLAIAAAFAQRPSPKGKLSYRDSAGFLILLGFVAAILTDSSAVALLSDAVARYASRLT